MIAVAPAASSSDRQLMAKRRRFFSYGWPPSPAGSVVTLAAVAVLTVAMLPMRPHLSVASAGLVLVVPVVLGVVIGGLPTGIMAVVAGFLAYDIAFIPPYGTLAVGATQNWVALGVYAVVLVLVATVVTDQRRARSDWAQRERETRRLFELSEAIISEQPDLAQRIVDTVEKAFGARWAALLLPTGNSLGPTGGRLGVDGNVLGPTGARLGVDGNSLCVAATAGSQVPLEHLGSLLGRDGAPSSASSPVHLLERVDDSDRDAPAAVALVADGTPIGLLAISPAPASRHDRRVLAIFANQVALAIGRANLRQVALDNERLAAGEQARQVLLRTVSHDLRTPLATIKASLSDIRDPESELGEAARQDLLSLAEEQADRLDRLVANLLDMTRVEAGSLAVQLASVAVDELVDEALLVLGRPPVTVQIPPELPAVRVDHTLICHVLANLLENALRYSPADVVISATIEREGIQLTVADRGPGMSGSEPTVAARVEEPVHQIIVGEHERPRAKPEHERPWPKPAPPHHASPSSTTESGGEESHRGFGLAIAEAFVAAHGSHVVVEANPEGGTRVSFTLPAVAEARPSLDAAEL